MIGLVRLRWSRDRLGNATGACAVGWLPDGVQVLLLKRVVPIVLGRRAGER